MHVTSIPAEGESVLGSGFEEPLDGAKATNQAVCAARLGAAVRFITVLGNDERGKRWRAFFDREGLDMRWATTVEKPTDVGFVLIGPNGASACATALEANLELDRERLAGLADAFESCSIVLCQLEASQEAAVAAFRAARERGVLTVLNPSPAADLARELIEFTDVLVANESESARLLGMAAGTWELARGLRRAYPGCSVIVTAGERGAYVCDSHGGELHVAAPEVKAVDTTGAGDAFLGSLAVRIQSGDRLDDAVRYAVLAASRSVTLPGSLPSYGTEADLDAWRDELSGALVAGDARIIRTAP